MSLTPGQQQVASRIYAHAIHAGLPSNRAQELVSAALAESNLDPSNYYGKSQGKPFQAGKTAGGLFELLSGGYVRRAQQLGGIFNPDANIEAILPSYLNYWRQHPNAAPGEAGRDVERSGEGADFYAKGLAQLGGVKPGMGPVPGTAPDVATAPASASPEQARRQLAVTLINNIGHKGPPDFQALAEAVRGLSQAREQSPTEPAPPAGGSATTTAAGGYSFPLEGSFPFENDWGAPRTGHRHAGIDIPAPEGTPILAVQDGVVTDAGPSGAAGNRIWIDGKWFYAHLSRFAVKPGDHVRAGQVIGYVGSTGDATGPHLHFGWSPNGSHGASWANPYPVLERLSKGS